MNDLPVDDWTIYDHDPKQIKVIDSYECVRVKLPLQPSDGNRKKPSLADITLTEEEAIALNKGIAKVLMDKKAEVEIGPEVDAYRRQQIKELDANVKAYEKKLRKERGLLTEDEKKALEEQEEAERKEALDLVNNLGNPPES